VISAIGVLSVPLVAGVVMISSIDSYVKPKGELTSKSMIGEDRMRVETKGQDIDQILIFRGDKELFWLIDNKASTVMEITKKDLQEMLETLKGMMSAAEESMKGLPPELQEMMNKVTKGHVQADAPVMVYEKKSSGEKVNQWTCDRYEGRLGEEKTQEVWTTDWKKLGFTFEDIKVMQDIGEFFEGFSKEFSAAYKLGSKEWEKEQGYSGLPVKTILYSGGRVHNKIEVKEMKHQDFESSLFELPDGLEKTTMPGLGTEN
jgi:hypothetical protein